SGVGRCQFLLELPTVTGRPPTPRATGNVPELPRSNVFFVDAHLGERLRFNLLFAPLAPGPRNFVLPMHAFGVADPAPSLAVEAVAVPSPLDATGTFHASLLLYVDSPSAALMIAISATPRMLPSYHLFKVVFPDLCDLHAWRPYNSEALWTSAAARDAFVPPDLRDRLPDTVELDSSIDSRLKTAFASAMAAKAVGGDQKTPTAAQGELQENFMALLGDYDAEVTRRPSVGGNTGDDHSDDSNNDNERFLAAVADGKLAAPGLHHG
ncbi:hypothetical protein HK405_015130, partial [Cladochytrium tenue]